MYAHLAVAAYLSLFEFTLKTSLPSRFNPNLTESIPEKLSLAPLEKSREWDIGIIYAEAQNLARTVRFLLCHPTTKSEY